MEVSVEPKILSWARESIGLTIDNVAKRLGTTEKSVFAFEQGERNVTLKTLKKLALIYKRSLATFLLPSPPVEPPMPTDFRSLPSEKKKELTSKTFLAIRNARRYQSLAIELAKSMNKDISKKYNNVDITENPEKLAKQIRNGFDIPLSKQETQRNEYFAFNYWKQLLENSNVLVFQFSMPLDEIRAFSIVEGEMPVIAINTKDSLLARVFSLFHEYAHILLNISGICNLEDEYTSGQHKNQEIFCNHFAGAFLLPENVFEINEFRKGMFNKNNIDVHLEQIAKRYKVSKEVVLRRMLIFGFIDKNLYQFKKKEWGEKEWIVKKGGKNKPDRRCVQEKGKNYISLVLEAHKEKKITFRDVADYLTIKTKYISKVMQLIE